MSASRTGEYCGEEAQPCNRSPGLGADRSEDCHGRPDTLPLLPVGLEDHCPPRLYRQQTFAALITDVSFV